MIEKIKLIFRAMIEHKFKFVLMVFSALIFIFLLFPFDDLGELVTAQVAKITNNQVYVQFDRLSVGVLEPGLQLRNVYLEASGIPPLSAQELVVTPSVTGIISNKPAGSMSLHGFLKGDLEVAIKSGGKSDGGIERQKIKLAAKKMSLADIKDLADLPVAIKGKLDLTASATTDLTFQEQPDMDVTLHIDKFELPGGNVNTMMGPLTLPELKLTSIDLKGRLSAGRFQIEEGFIGRPGDDLRGTVSGSLTLQIRNTPQGIIPQIGAYDFSFDLSVKRDLQDRAALFLSFLDQYKSPTTEGARYRFKVSATSPFMPPNIGAMR